MKEHFPNIFSGKNIERWNKANPDNNITSITQLYSLATVPIQRELTDKLDALEDSKAEPWMLDMTKMQKTRDIWDKWVEKWSIYTINNWLMHGDWEYLETKYRGNADVLGWTASQINAIRMVIRTPGWTDTNIVQLLQDGIGGFWANPMYTLQG